MYVLQVCTLDMGTCRLFLPCVDVAVVCTSFVCANQQNKQMNEVLFDLQNPILDIIYNHCTKQ
jgi:hypothetical protein